MQKVLLIDPEKCNGCRTCEAVCSLVHEGRCNPAESRISVVAFREAGLYIPMTCQHCQSPPCDAVCPTNAVRRDEKLGRVVIDADLCIGCRMCLVVCPFGGIGLDARGERVIHCDLCDGDPLCAKFCETEAIRYLDAAQLGAVKRREAAGKLSQIEGFGGAVRYEWPSRYI